LAALVLTTLTQAVGAEEAIGIDLTADFYSKYIWRGQNLNDDYAFQPSAAVTYRGLTAAIWGSLDLTNISGNSGEFTESDYSLDYSGDVPGIEHLGFSMGVIHYRFPGIGHTTELYWGFALDAPLNPSVTVYHDIDEIGGAYVSLGLGHSIDKVIELTPGLPVGMEIGTSLGIGDSDYNEGYWGVNDAKPNDLKFSIAFPMEIAGWTFAPSINYVTLVSDAIRQSDAFAKDSDYFFTGLSLSRSF
jgi:hypothetical protein